MPQILKSPTTAGKQEMFRRGYISEEMSIVGKIAINRVTGTYATGNYRKPEAAQNKVAVNRQAGNLVRHDTQPQTYS